MRWHTYWPMPSATQRAAAIAGEASRINGGAPDASGRFGDDNSLIKGVPRSLPVTNPANALLNGSRVGTGFVAAHVGRKLTDGPDAPKSEATNSFLPNLVWLPRQLAKLTDREGGYAQTLLQAVSLELYRRQPLKPKLAAFVAPIWGNLPVRDEVGEIDISLGRLNFSFARESLFLVNLRPLANPGVAPQRGPTHHLTPFDRLQAHSAERKWPE